MKYGHKKTLVYICLWFLFFISSFIVQNIFLATNLINIIKNLD